MRLFDHIRRHKSASANGLVPVFSDSARIGWTKAETAPLLAEAGDSWVWTGGQLHLSEKWQSFADRTKAVDAAFQSLSQRGVLPPLPDYDAFGGHDWIPVCLDPLRQPHFVVRRHYMPIIGILTESVMVNGFDDSGYWLGMRSQKVDTGKGQYDLIAAGTISCAQSFNDHRVCLEHAEEDKCHSPYADFTRQFPNEFFALQFQPNWEASILYATHKELEEESGLYGQSLQKLTSAHSLRLFYNDANGWLYRELFHIFDLPINKANPPHVINPLEVERFEHVSFPQLSNLMLDGRIKSHINLVVADFLLRHRQLPKDACDLPQLFNLLNESHEIF